MKKLVQKGVKSSPEKLFHEGKNYRAYDYLGAHFKDDSVTFRAWAPNAKAVSVVGDFNGWDVSANKMKNISNSGIWETSISSLKQYDNYKFAITAKDDHVIMKADPFAFHAETRPGTASKLYDMSGYKWGDTRWSQYNGRYNINERPMNIYEVHIGSWRKNEDGSFYSYCQLADTLVPYVKQMGYTHIELLPIAEYPYDGSWGYQVTGYYAASSRYGTPHDLMYFIDTCHQMGVGVIVDWVAAHFPKDEAGLYEFDGTYQYEYADPLKREHADWGTRIFDYGKNEVRAFLISNAMFWVEYYHIDGIRVDAVASMLYLDYGKQNGEWRANEHGGRENLEAKSFLQELNTTVLNAHPNTIMIAEESTAWPLVTCPPYDGGLGFHFKWNMGWMNDTLEYFSTDPYFRSGCHNKLTFSLTYAFSESYILPLSHDEVVHGKRSLIEKQPGEYNQKFAGLRAMLGYTMMHPGKKLSFMGNEFGQFIEWDYENQLDWFLLSYDAHRKMHEYVRDLNAFYLANSQLWQIERDWSGFKWLQPDDSGNNIIAFCRKNKKGEVLIVVCNFSPVGRESYHVPVTSAGKYVRVFTSDDKQYGGDGAGDANELITIHEQTGEFKYSLPLTVPGMSVSVYRRAPKKRL